MIAQIIHHTEDAPEKTAEKVDLGHFLRAVFDVYEFGSSEEGMDEHLKWLLAAQIYGEDAILKSISDVFEDDLPMVADCIWDFVKCEPSWDINEKAFNWFFESRMMGKEPDWQTLGHILVGRGIESVDEKMFTLLFQSPTLDPLVQSERNKFNLFQVAVDCGNIETAKFLMARFPEIDLVNAGDVPPLHLAVRKENAQLVALLLENGADVHALSEKQTAIMWAIEAANVEIFETLLKKVDVDFKSEGGSSLREFASEYSDKVWIEAINARGGLPTCRGTPQCD